MVLKFNGNWRFMPPEDGHFFNKSIPGQAVEAFIVLVLKVATQGRGPSVLEHFKRHFCLAIGSPYNRSSSESWAETDLRSYMQEAATNNAPLFIEAFFDACETLRSNHSDWYIPDVALINSILDKHDIGYKIESPNLVFREKRAEVVSVPDRPITLAENAIEVYQTSLKRSEQLLSEGHHREAVQEILWLLETVTTAFRGVETESGTVEGKYFNQIVRDLRLKHPGTTLERVLDWVTALHGFLSSPSGGGVRHGLDLKRGVGLSPNEARLFCNLIRSYLSFLLAEHERLNL